MTESQTTTTTNAPTPLGVHHVAYRCKDAKETVEFYTNMLGMNFKLAIAEDEVP
ncbi:MAG: glyoxalase, partial [Robiginitomaculum sp.]